MCYLMELWPLVALWSNAFISESLSSLCYAWGHTCMDTQAAWHTVLLPVLVSRYSADRQLVAPIKEKNRKTGQEFKYFMNLAVQMFYEEENAFNVFFRPQRHTRCILVSWFNTNTTSLLLVRWSDSSGQTLNAKLLFWSSPCSDATKQTPQMSSKCAQWSTSSESQLYHQGT